MIKFCPLVTFLFIYLAQYLCPSIYALSAAEKEQECIRMDLMALDFTQIPATYGRLSSLNLPYPLGEKLKVVLAKFSTLS